MNAAAPPMSPTDPSADATPLNQLHLNGQPVAARWLHGAVAKLNEDATRVSLEMRS